MTGTSRSPLKDRPLRHPGQSLEEERRALFEDKLEPWLLMAALFVCWAVFEWYRYFANPKPQPVLFTLAALLVGAFAVWRFHRIRPRFRALRQGADGEKAVGQFLERLRSDGYEVFHDIVGPTFNVDHVLIGPAGVFTVETKTWSKPGPDARVRFDGDELVVGGIKPDRSPIVQAQAQASWMQALLLESTGRKVRVAPILLFPGWYVEQSESSLSKIWVLEPKALPAFLAKESVRLQHSDVTLMRFHLSRFIRGGERERAVAGPLA